MRSLSTGCAGGEPSCAHLGAQPLWRLVPAPAHFLARPHQQHQKGGRRRAAPKESSEGRMDSPTVARPREAACPLCACAGISRWTGEGPEARHGPQEHARGRDRAHGQGIGGVSLRGWGQRRELWGESREAKTRSGTKESPGTGSVPRAGDAVDCVLTPTGPLPGEHRISRCTVRHRGESFPLFPLSLPLFLPPPRNTISSLR